LFVFPIFSLYFHTTHFFPVLCSAKHALNSNQQQKADVDINTSKDTPKEPAVLSSFYIHISPFITDSSSSPIRPQHRDAVMGTQHYTIFNV